MCTGHLSRASKFLTVLHFIFIATFSGNLMAQEGHFRFASNRIVMVKPDISGAKNHSHCREIRQKDNRQTVFPQLHMHSEQPFRLIDMAVNADDSVMAAGVFSGVLDLNGQVLETPGDQDIFFLILDASGALKAFQQLGGPGRDLLFAVEVNSFGEFELQAATRRTLDQGFSTEPFRAFVDQDGLNLNVYLADLQFLLDESDEEEVGDPGGSPIQNPNRLLDESDEEEVGDPGGSPVINPSPLLDESDEEEVGDPGGSPIQNPSRLLDESDEEEVGDPGGSP